MDQLRHVIEIWTGYGQSLAGSIGALAFVMALGCVVIKQWPGIFRWSESGWGNLWGNGRCQPVGALERRRPGLAVRLWLSLAPVVVGSLVSFQLQQVRSAYPMGRGARASGRGHSLDRLWEQRGFCTGGSR